MKVQTHEFARSARRELADANARGVLDFLAAIGAKTPEEALSSVVDPAASMELARAIRAEAVARLPELLEQFERNASARGATVLWARDAAEANAQVLRIAKERGVDCVAKGKSMVTEELGLNSVLEEAGIEVWETDLGEFIAQLAKRPPFHIVGPALNFSVEEISALFVDKGVIGEPSSDPVQLGRAARRFLRGRFHRLEMGITGVNMAIAETGTILNVENEGNIRFCKSSPRTQVSIMTIEKVVPTVQDAMHLVRVLCRCCTRQDIAAYVSMDTGPKNAEESDGPEQLFIIIVDNGRSGFYRDVVKRQSLHCIRCGACMFACPVYLKIGGYPYGWAYMGPMGQVLNPLLLGPELTSDLCRACTLCGACKAICPGGIDHPRLLLSHRAEQAMGECQDTTIGGPDDRHDRHKPQSPQDVQDWQDTGQRRRAIRVRPRQEGWFYAIFGWLAARARRWALATKVLRFLLRPFSSGGVVRDAKGLSKGWFAVRDLPAMSEKTFRERMKNGDQGSEQRLGRSR